MNSEQNRAHESKILPYIDFINAVKRNEIYMPSLDGVKTYKISFKDQFLAPCFDVGNILNEDKYRCDLFFDNGKSEWLEGRTVLPFRRFVISYLLNGGENALLFVSEKNCELHLTRFVHEVEGEEFRLGWHCDPCIVILSKEDYFTKPLMPNSGLCLSDDHRELMAEHATTILWNTIAALDHIDATRETMELEQIKKVNRHRRKRGQQPIPTPVRIKIDTVRYAQPTLQNGTGTVRIPHNRRAHKRYLKRSNRWVPVKSSAIHGGSGARDYKVTL